LSESQPDHSYRTPPPTTVRKPLVLILVDFVVFIDYVLVLRDVLADVLVVEGERAGGIAGGQRAPEAGDVVFLGCKTG
jgi:hypothetical protein